MRDRVSCLVYIVFWIILGLVGEHFAGYILGVFFGDITPWENLAPIIRYGIGILLAYPIIVLAILVFIASQFVPVPFF